MKLYEIPNYLEKKLRKSWWFIDGELAYIQFKNGYWLQNNGVQIYMHEELANCESWVEYIEPKKKVKKSFDRWFNVYKDHIGFSYSTKEETDVETKLPDNRVITQQKVTFEYFVEE